MITIYTAKSIITMNRSLPRAEAVAIRDGQIIEVGSLDSMQPWLGKHEHEIDNQFKDAIIVPGLIDPHLHPPMAAVLLPMHFITAMEWRLPWQTVPASTTPEAFDKRLAELIDNNDRLNCCLPGVITTSGTVPFQGKESTHLVQITPL